MDEMLNELDNYLTNTKDKTNEIYNSYKIDKNNFFKTKKECFNNQICFVDGGSSVLIDSPSFSLGFIKSASIIYKNKKIKKIITNQFFVFAYTFFENEKIYYKTKYFKYNQNSQLIDEIIINSKDKNFSINNEPFSISKMIDLSRRILEIKTSIESINYLNEGDIILLDGTLKTLFDFEKKKLDKLYEIAIKNNILISSILKTNNAITNNGNCLLASISKIAPAEIWYYDDFIDLKNEMQKSIIYFLKLHKLSDYIFTLEIYKEQTKLLDIKKVVSYFAYYSNDAVFLGYPYGLIKADSLARISNNETEMLLTTISSKNKKLFNLIKPYIKSNDAHGVLDNISF
ncbi:MAG: DNA double-strand break repair nuclease NurA [Candidatus Woesearchaeota archaeon]